jgi:hypothetical protein
MKAIHSVEDDFFLMIENSMVPKSFLRTEEGMDCEAFTHSHELWALMSNCWLADPIRRPSVLYVEDAFRELIEQPQGNNKELYVLITEETDTAFGDTATFSAGTELGNLQTPSFLKPNLEDF